ncbi:hypothetical protein [Flammeovirga agarivorans]|uniref:Uncharacterized protein n=1 Tax=Flammeovirga agarivorans TaxID=2726742 RepID=A0A7X8SQ15_9BACT|nr:hypothetical protein [Flammeovirga agarivorans]NLR94206.1 hypothetical protein [Flammeovirga agarivorans]
MTQELLNYYDNSPLGVAIYRRKSERQFEFYYYNKAGRKMDGAMDVAYKGKMIDELYPNVNEMGLVDALEEVYQTGVSQVVPLKGYKMSKSDILYRTNRVQKLKDEYVVSVYSDESDTFSYIRQIEKDNKNLNNALDFISHHLRGNLSTSLGILELFRATEVSLEEKNFLMDVVKKNLENIDSKIHHLVDVLYKEVKHDEKLLKKYSSETQDFKDIKV